MGIKHVEYNLKQWKGVLSSVCELFADINTSYVPIWRFVEKDSLLAIAQLLKNYGEEFYNVFADMLDFDALIFNTDRHTGNFGLLVDRHTNEVKAFAPVFDNGLSLFNLAMEDDLADIANYSKTCKSALGGSYEDVAKEFVSERQRAMPRKMNKFKFVPHPRDNLPKTRLKKIEKFLGQRVHELLEL